MVQDAELEDRLRLLLAEHSPSTMRMFGGLAFLVQGHMALAASGQGGILVRVDPAQRDALLVEPGAEPFEMRGRPMAGWLRVDAAALDDDAVLRRWAERGMAYARTLPPKRQAPGRHATTSRRSGPAS